MAVVDAFSYICVIVMTKNKVMALNSMLLPHYSENEFLIPQLATFVLSVALEISVYSFNRNS